MLISGPYPEHLKRRILSPYGHMSNEECAMALAENATSNLKHVWLCHLSDENNHPDLAEKSVKQIYGRMVSWLAMSQGQISNWKF